MPRWRFVFAATLIILIAAVLRVSALSSIPPGLHYDEAANGVIVRNIAFDAYRPVFIPDYTGKEVLWFYAASVMMRIVGPTIFALRLTSALCGVVSVAATGSLIRRLYPGDERRDALSLLSMAVLAVALWHGIISRFADRAVTQPLLQALSLGLLWHSLQIKQARRRFLWMALAGMVTGLAAYTYLAVRLFPIVLAAAWIALLIVGPHRRQRLLDLLVFGLAALIVFAPLGWYFLQHPEAFTIRIEQVGPPSPAAALQGWGLALRMFFLSGDPYIRFNLPSTPLFGPVLAGFFLLGLLVAGRDMIRATSASGKARGILLLIWPLVMLAPTALAVGEITPSNLRAIGLAPLIVLYPALGIAEVVQRLRQRETLRAYVERWAAPAALALILASGLLTVQRLQRWGTDQLLYYENDGHVAALARYLNDEPLHTVTTYLATYHFRHPTLTFLAEQSAEARSLFGGDALVTAPTGPTLIAYTRDALPPDEWLSSLESYRVASPSGPDGTPDFYVYKFPSEIPLEVAAVPPANFANVIQLEGARFYPTRSGGTASIDLAWRILGAAPSPDYAFIVEICDVYDWCWVKANLDGSVERGTNNTYNSTQWTAGERLLTRIDVPIPQGMPPGDYLARISIFSSQGGNRLTLLDSANGFAGLYAAIPGVNIQASTEPDLNDLPIQVRLAEQPAPLVSLIGYDLPVREARPGEQVPLALHWLSMDRQPDDMDVTLQLGSNVILYADAPVHGTYPLTLWQPNELITDRYQLRVPVDLSPGIYPLAVRLGESGPINLGSITVKETSRQFVPPPMEALGRPVVFGGSIALLGYQAPRSLISGQPIDLTLVWRAETQIEMGYTIFVHLIDEQGNIVVQDDRVPFVGGEPYPTNVWLPGEVVTDTHTLTIPPDLRSSEYQIRVGLYLPDNGQRLSVPDHPDNAVILPASFTVP